MLCYCNGPKTSSDGVNLLKTSAARKGVLAGEDRDAAEQESVEGSHNCSRKHA